MAKYKLKKNLGKKGIFMTFIAISIIATFMVISVPSDIVIKTNLQSVNTRISNINNYVEDLENVYLERSLYSSSIKTINSLIGYMEDMNEFLDSFEDSFEEVIIYGTINGDKIEDMIGGNTFINWTNKIKIPSEKALNVKTDFFVEEIEVYQDSPWHINVLANVSFNVTSETVSWHKNVIVITDISIEGFEDPYYSINTQGKYKKRINRSYINNEQLHSDRNQIRELIKHESYLHIESNTEKYFSPSFIMRFTNTSLGSACCGIESIVDPNELIEMDQMESYADYLFFNHTFQDKCNKLYNITEIQDDFPNIKFSYDHLIIYNFTREYQPPKAC